jgi:hypothetical protein
MQVMDQIQGKDGQLLPWEGERMNAAVKQKLGIFRHTVLHLLQREPAKRKSMAEFCETCNRVLSGTTTVGRESHCPTD